MTVATLSLPATSAFVWSVGQFGPCSLDCEPVRTRAVECKSGLDVVDDSNCDASIKPEPTAKCELQTEKLYDFEFPLVKTSYSEIDDEAYAQTVFYPRVPEDMYTGEGNINEWVYIYGPTPSANTGPGSDHTTGTSSGHYFYVEASSPNIPGSSYLESPLIDMDALDSSSDCNITFWLYGRGPASGAHLQPLQTELVDCQSPYSTTPVTPGVYSISDAGFGDYGAGATPADRHWVKETVVLPPGLTGKHRFRWIHTKVSGGSDADWAIDDVTFGAGCAASPPRSSCDPADPARAVNIGYYPVTDQFVSTTCHPAWGACSNVTIAGQTVFIVPSSFATSLVPEPECLDFAVIVGPPE